MGGPAPSLHRESTDSLICSYYDPVDVCCAAVHVHNAYNSTFTGIAITVQTPNMSGVVFVNLSNIKVQFNTACFSSFSSSQMDLSIGILVYKANVFEIYSSSANNCSCGLELHTTNNGHVSSTTAMYNHPYNDILSSTGGIGGIGMLLFSTDNTIIINPRKYCKPLSFHLCYSDDVFWTSSVQQYYCGHV